MMSVAIAVFLFASLRAVLDGFDAVAPRARRTRVVTIRSTSMIFRMPTNHVEVIQATPGVQDVDLGELVRRHLQGSQELLRPVRHRSRELPAHVPRGDHLTPEEKKAFLEDRTGCIVGDGLAKKYGWHVGDRIVLQPGIPIYGIAGLSTFTIRGIYRAGSSAVDNQSMMFHWKYADERSSSKGQVGWIVAQVADPDRAAQVSRGDRSASSPTRRTRRRPTRSRRFRRRSRTCSAT